MSDRVAELAEQGKALSPEDRVRLLDLLLESLHDSASVSVEQAWEAEIERRVALHDQGGSILHDAAEVLAEAARIAP